MNDARPRVLLASHDTTPLPPVAATLSERGIEVFASGNLVDTAAAIADKNPDVVVFQPLTNQVGGFEIQHVLSLGGAERTYAVLLVLHDAAELSRLLADRSEEHTSELQS